MQENEDSVGLLRLGNESGDVRRDDHAVVTVLEHDPTVLAYRSGLPRRLLRLSLFEQRVSAADDPGSTPGNPVDQLRSGSSWRLRLNVKPQRTGEAVTQVVEVE